MKKIFLLLITLTMLTGCSVEYNLNISKNKITEETKFNVSNEEFNTNKEVYDYPYSIFIDEFISEEDGITTNEEFTYYTKNITNKDDNYILTYNANYDKSDYYRSRLLNTAFNKKNISINSYNGYLIARDFNIFNNYKSKNIETITINITIDPYYEVTDNNADSIKNNTYQWKYINDGNKKKNIIFEFTKRKEEQKESNESENSNKEEEKWIKTENYTIYIVLGIIVILIISGYIIFNKMKERNNRLDD